MVGKGAFGKVYQALNLNSGELMAVKCVELGNVSDADMEEIRNEVQLLRSLKHRHVVQYIATHQMEGSLNILMEFCPGGSVATLLRSFGPLPESVLAQYSRQMMEGIGYIHQHQVFPSFHSLPFIPLQTHTPHTDHPHPHPPTPPTRPPTPARPPAHPPSHLPIHPSTRPPAYPPMKVAAERSTGRKPGLRQNAKPSSLSRNPETLISKLTPNP